MTLEVHAAAGKIIFAFGALSFLGLILLWVRQRRLPHWPWPLTFYPLLFACLAGWFVLNLMTSDFLVLLAGACLFPPLLHRLGGRPGLWVNIMLAGVLALAAVWLRTGGGEPDGTGALAGAYGVLLAFSLLAAMRPGGAAGLWFAAGACVVAGLALWTRNPWLTLAMRTLPLAFLFVESYERRRFLFLDLFVKWAAYYSIALAILAGALTLAPPGLSPLTKVLLLLPLLYIVPALLRVVGGWLDRTILRRPMPALRAQALFAARIDAATTEATLIEQAAVALGEIFGTRAEIRLAELAPAGMAGCAAITAGGRRTGWAALHQRPDRRPLFSEDYELLGTLSASLGTAIEARRAQIRAVQAQINPHFLFNSLNTVASLIHDAPELAESTVLRLASIFRHALERSRSEWTALEAEFAFVEDAIEVERARFGVVEADIDLPGELRGFRIPSMALHILVENAFKHGVSKATPPKRIEVSAERAGGKVRLRVADNGPGLAVGAQATGRGLEILRELLVRHYGARASVRLERDETRGLTVALLEIPA
ncbi:MAG: hypothetical protein C0504_08390 [Candidatus Solibacter sp.]|nr:hypothetical protein [Candidatus Solibacter sp.]